ncbi:hypothetical protein M422DRAFT_779187 [Sphaerobolus stellatus SS14]|uniref:Unplaced genomic scaffold SPHSTscaffold_38, whole genome shotgun sequence n=1 Tax=Sphaerobolus stellatus (strain SS14) TaxID=990650 RepID=A0A0C9UQU6_SPHS4|nr:hypothetical protein M422DRAFT_779187 [Sphaerobolus stellatus SS14]
MLWGVCPNQRHLFRTSVFNQKLSVIHFRWVSGNSNASGFTPPIIPIPPSRPLIRELNAFCQLPGRKKEDPGPPISRLDAFAVTARSLLLRDSPPETIHRVLKRKSPDHYSTMSKPKTACVFVEEQVKLGNATRAIDLVQIAHRLGHTFRLKDYEKVAYQFAIMGQWQNVRVITSIARNTTGTWSARILDWALQAYVQLQDYERMGQILEEYEYCGLHPRRSTFLFLVKGYLENSDLFGARDILQKMTAAGYPIDKRLFAVILTAYKTIGSDPKVEAQAIQSLKGLGDPLETTILNALLRARIADADIDGAVRMLELLNISSTSINPNDASNPPPGGIQMLDIDTSLIRPNVETFNTLFWLIASRRDCFPQCKVVYGHMLAIGECPDDESVAAIAQTYTNAGMSDHAVTLVREICNRIYGDVSQSRFSIFGTILDPAIIEKDFPGILAMEPTIKILNVFVRNMLPRTRVPGIKQFFELLEWLTIMPDSMTTDIILDHLRKVHDMDPALLVMVVQTLTTFPTYEASLNMTHLNTILAAYIQREARLAKAHSWNASAQRVRFGHPSPLKPELLQGENRRFDPTAGIAMDSFQTRHRGLVKWVLGPMVRSLSRQGIKSSRHTFALRIRREGLIKRNMDAALQVFEIMISRGITPHQVHYCHLMEGYAVAGDMNQAYLMMQRAYANKIPPNVFMYTILMQGWARLGKPQKAHEVFREMLAASVRPDLASVDVIISAFFFVGAYRSARNLLLEVWPLVAKHYPADLPETATLRQLVDQLRKYRDPPTPHRVKPTETIEEQKRRRELRKAMFSVLDELRRWRGVAQSVSWVKTDITFDYILHTKEV